MKKLYNKAQIGIGRIMMQKKYIFEKKRGEGFIDTAVKILISVVIGALLLAGLYALFGDTVMPTLTEKIEDMFNYSN